MHLPQRKQSRLGCFDYSESGSYFITICTEGRRNILSEISAGAGFPDSPEVTCILLDSGKTVEKWIQKMNCYYDDISVDCYVIMPDHVHLLLSLTEDSGLSGRPVVGGLPDAPIQGPLIFEPSPGIRCGLSRRPAPTGSRRPAPTGSRCNAAISRFVGTLKRFTNREIGEKIWQRSFYDHVIRNQQDYEEAWNYIEDNPRKWICARNHL